MMTIIKLLVLGAIIKAKIDLAVKIFSAAVQTKIFFLLLSILMLQKIKLFVDLKKNLQPTKEIHYEETQHDHHYNGDIWGNDEHSSGWGR